jgi:hypothetical protein
MESKDVMVAKLSSSRDRKNKKYLWIASGSSKFEPGTSELTFELRCASCVFVLYNSVIFATNVR